MNSYLGGKAQKECPHKNITRFYDSPPTTAKWRCDWCGQDFTPLDAEKQTVDINEVGTYRTTFDGELPRAQASTDIWTPPAADAPGADEPAERDAVSASDKRVRRNSRLKGD